MDMLAGYGAANSSSSNITNATRCCPIPRNSTANTSNVTDAAALLSGLSISDASFSSSSSNTSNFLQNCSWGVGFVCPEPPAPKPPDHPPSPIPDEDGGIFVAGVIVARGGGGGGEGGAGGDGGLGGLRELWLNCTSRPGQGGGGRQWSEVVALPSQSHQGRAAGGVRSGGFVLRLNSTGSSRWVQGLVPAISGGKRSLAGIRLSPWISTSPDTYAAHSMPTGGGAEAAGAAGVYVICLLKATSTGAPDPADGVAAWVDRQNASAALNLTRVPGDALLLALLAGAGGDLRWLRLFPPPPPPPFSLTHTQVFAPCLGPLSLSRARAQTWTHTHRWLRLVSGPSLSLDLATPASGASGAMVSDSLAYVPLSWKGGALTMQRWV